METPNSADQKSQALIEALQKMNSGMDKMSVFNSLKDQGFSEEDSKEVMQKATLETKGDLVNMGRSLFSVIKTGAFIVLGLVIVLSFLLTPFLGIPLGLVGGVIITVALAKRKIIK